MVHCRLINDNDDKTNYFKNFFLKPLNIIKLGKMFHINLILNIIKNIFLSKNFPQANES